MRHRRTPPLHSFCEDGRHCRQVLYQYHAVSSGQGELDDSNLNKLSSHFVRYLQICQYNYISRARRWNSPCIVKYLGNDDDEESELDLFERLERILKQWGGFLGGGGGESERSSVADLPV